MNTSDRLITSAQNPKIKRLLALQQKSAERRQSGLFVVEGRRELEHCLQAGFTVDTVFYCPSVLQEQAGDASSVLAPCVARSVGLPHVEKLRECPLFHRFCTPK